MNTINQTASDPETITSFIRETYPETDVVEMGGAWFFSLDPEKHWPNFATIVTTDDFDAASNLSRPGVFRLNIGVDRATFERLVERDQEPDYTALDRVLSHPVYSRQHWVCILNPSASCFEEVVVPLLAIAHDRLAAQRARHRRCGTN